MRVQIYQINEQRDNEHKHYASFKSGDTVDPSIYDEVFDAEIDVTTPEDVHRMMKFEGHPLMRGVNVTVSDIVAMNGRAYYCQPNGFADVPFDVSKTQKPDNLIRVVYVEPNKPAYVADVGHTLDAEQKAVGGGLIQTLYWTDDNTTIVANDEAKLKGMPGNRRFGDGSTIIAGPFFIVGVEGEDFRSLTDEEVTKYMTAFEQPDQISQDEVEADMGFTIISM